MSNMEIIDVVSIATIFLDIYLVHLIFSGIFIKKGNVKLQVIASVSFILIASILTRIQINGELRLAVNTLLILLLSFLVYRGFILSRIMASAFFYCVYLVGDFFGYGVDAFLGRGQSWIGIIGLYAYMLAFSFIFRKMTFVENDPIDKMTQFTILFGSITCAAIMIILINYFRFLSSHAKSAEIEIPPLLFIVCGLFFLVFNMIIIMMSKSQADRRVSLRRQLVYESQLRQYENYYETIEAMHTEMREIRHDQRFHLETLYRLIDRHDLIEAKEYIQEVQTIIPNTSYGHSGNLVVDVMLHSFLSKATLNRIQTSVVVNIMDIKIASVDLCIVMGNALENALDACKKLREIHMSCIRVRLEQKKQLLYFEVVNPVEWEIDISEDLPLSTKENSQYHGFGLRSIQNVVAKYDGHVSYRKEANAFILKCMIKNETIT